MILYNGQTGSLGRYLHEILQKKYFSHYAIKTRLENSNALLTELQALILPRTTETVSLIHLASMVPVLECEANPQLARNVNVIWTRNYITEIVKWAFANGKKVKIIYVSTGHVYDSPNGTEKITEQHPVLPRSIYAKTKLEAERELEKMAQEFKFDLIVARVFGLIAPLQPPFYVLPGLINRAKQKSFANIQGLYSFRDYLDSRDVANILMALIQINNSVIINICSGNGTSIKNILSKIVNILYPNEAETLISHFSSTSDRPDGIPYMVGDNKFLTETIKIVPCTITLEQTINDALKGSFDDPAYKSPQLNHSYPI